MFLSFRGVEEALIFLLVFKCIDSVKIFCELVVVGEHFDVFGLEVCFLGLEFS